MKIVRKAVCFMPALAIAAMAIHSYSKCDTIDWSAVNELAYPHFCLITSEYSEVSVWHSWRIIQGVDRNGIWVDEDAYSGEKMSLKFHSSQPQFTEDGIFGKFDWYNSPPREPFSGCMIQVPYWFLFVIAIIPPLGWTAFRRHRRTIPPGICGKCNYDLRASKDRCPECGTAIPAAKAGGMGDSSSLSANHP